ncbi:MAG: ABC transporter permease subunit [Clostridia bacterium]|nr:ABC transporter permease subunit [Clostridia bacterium]
MLKLLKIETFKLFKRTKTWVILIAFILLTALIAYGTYRDAENMKMWNSPEARIANNEEYLKILEEQMEEIPEDIKDDPAAEEEYKKNLQESIQQVKEEIAHLKVLAEQDEDGDWRKVLEQRIEELEGQKESLKESSEYKDMEAYNEQEIERLKYLLDNDIKLEGQYDFNARKFLTSAVTILGQIFLVIGIAVFAADMVSGEATPPTMKLLLTQPVSRGKVLLAKFLSINISSVLLIIGVELIGFLLIGIFFGFGDANYPMVAGTRYMYDTTRLLENGSYPIIQIVGSSQVIPAWQYLMKLLLLQALFIVTCTSVVFLISTLVKTSMVSMGISVVSMIASFVIFLGFSALRSVAKYVFVLFGSVEMLLTGETVSMFNNPNVNMNSVVIMFIGWIVVSYIASHLVFTKKDILI